LAADLVFFGIVTDLTGSAKIADAFEQIVIQHRGVDALVNNAGTCPNFQMSPKHSSGYYSGIFYPDLNGGLEKS
jgi:NAD(P)-dependent dehydrogenase (short-subunit alcohol dehydrogenase family)